MRPDVPPPPPAVEQEPGREAVPWTVVDALLVFLTALVVSSFALAGVQAAVTAEVLADQTARALFLPVSGIVLAATAVVWLRVRYGRGSGRLLGDRRPTGRDAAIGAGLGLAAWAGIVLGIGLLVQLVMGDDPPELQETFRQLASDPRTAPLLALGAVLIAPVAEELFFRGLLFTAIRDRLGLWPGMGISGTLFALAHMDPAGDQTANLLVFLVIFPLGVLLAWSLDRYRTLVVPIVIHAVFNLIQVGFLVARVAGGGSG